LKNENHMQNGDVMQKKLKMHAGSLLTAFTVHAVSLTPHAKYDTTCTVDERFEWPWQPLKGIFIKNIRICSQIVLPHP
jgi:hypothetical protein